MAGKGGYRPNSGRKKKADEERIRDMCLLAASKHFGKNVSLFDKLAEIAIEAKSHRDRIAAITKLIEYAYGKPSQSIDVSSMGDKVSIPILQWIKESK